MGIYISNYIFFNLNTNKFNSQNLIGNKIKLEFDRLNK
jgi:hypothetical protein